MRKIIWLVLLLIALLWIAIATYWTGPEKAEKVYDFPELLLTPTVSPPDIFSTPPSATSSPEASSTSSIKVVSPTVTSTLNF
ncbi:TPA: hypothetical protein DIU27_03305 [Candidatus Collierbacteria bacterium]|uniref:Uncharacterized protein n=1 Tax=Candidatus Collierbacteria bacterium GW2011_GWB2_44_22 TaxID=1618387 RepID=A0A0G1I082_9BACT|nr:MAG: hypothetical protein UW44_C0003G0061 [Candidatus Collierbacteria bacterium GW2011_GWB2_44_22]HCQ31382.1 hypothetical protein [Candidatus Collierbacteria bacterium]